MKSGKLEPIVLYEDADILAVNKPAGLVVHSDGKTLEPNLSEWFLQRNPESKDVGEPGFTVDGKPVLRPGIVHRLDRETSGVILLAKTPAGFQHVKKQFQEHTIQKEYHTFVYGEMKTKKGVIDRPIGRSAQDFRKWSAQRGSKGERREAVTEYTVVGVNMGYSFVHAHPITGRTHQIRVHFKAINYPVVADSLYAPHHTNTLGFERLALHSYSITFTNLHGESKIVTAPYPLDFEHTLKTFTLK